MTSPPYWGLRDYGTEPLAWSGKEGCRHRWIAGPGHGPTSVQSSLCSLCGTWKGSLGLEPTPDLYVSHLLSVFREVWRVLRDDGTLWLNLGDSYAGSWGNYHPYSPPGKHGQRLKQTARWNRRGYADQTFLPPTATATKSGLKRKDLVGIPWRVALALQADGWYLRSDIIWHKANVLPESVKDRPTRAHEYLFLLTKQPRYYYDADAIREPLKDSTIRREQQGYRHAFASSFRGSPRDTRYPGGKVLDRVSNPAGRNKRSVWSIPASPYSGAHFATFPQDLVRPCIKAGCPPSGTVLDPFMGAGTVGLVCAELERQFIGIELNSSYIELARDRLRSHPRLPPARATHP